MLTKLATGVKVKFKLFLSLALVEDSVPTIFHSLHSDLYRHDFFSSESATKL